MPESTLQMMVCAYLKDKYPQYIVVASLNGVKITGKNKYGYIANLKKQCYHAGDADLRVLITEGKTIHLELKVNNNKQQPNQIEFEEKAKSLGHTYYVVKSLQEVIDIMKDIK